VENSLQESRYAGSTFAPSAAKFHQHAHPPHPLALLRPRQHQFRDTFGITSGMSDGRCRSLRYTQKGVGAQTQRIDNRS
jgi:hypothetical protein